MAIKIIFNSSLIESGKQNWLFPLGSDIKCIL